MSIQRTREISPVRAIVKTLAAGSLLTLALAGCTPDATPSPAPSDVPASSSAMSLDPLTCYLSGDKSVETPAVALQCGGGTAAEVDLAKASPSVELDLPILDWTVSSASRGTSGIGSSIVQVHTTNGERSCVYYRDMANDAETTTKTCQ